SLGHQPDPGQPIASHRSHRTVASPAGDLARSLGGVDRSSRSRSAGSRWSPKWCESGLKPIVTNRKPVISGVFTVYIRRSVCASDFVPGLGRTCRHDRTFLMRFDIPDVATGPRPPGLTNLLRLARVARYSERTSVRPPARCRWHEG